MLSSVIDDSFYLILSWIVIALQAKPFPFHSTNRFQYPHATFRKQSALWKMKSLARETMVVEESRFLLPEFMMAATVITILLTFKEQLFCN